MRKLGGHQPGSAVPPRQHTHTSEPITEGRDADGPFAQDGHSEGTCVVTDPAPLVNCRHELGDPVRLAAFMQVLRVWQSGGLEDPCVGDCLPTVLGAVTDHEVDRRIDYRSGRDSSAILDGFRAFAARIRAYWVL
ncbi:hypothetical protein [Micromonospora sp. NBC_01638]|uniref:hypothetical protein n=1 Tax=Micromonospora sp. NBC_01638 TaxID=2975982 RepID=UPI003865D7A3|nr:hypothetical protein OG811_03345 [Micromonospora sp. NBC_01638]